jgi:hypothetical protein
LLAIASASERDRSFHKCPVIFGVWDLRGHYPGQYRREQRSPVLLGESNLPSTSDLWR